MSVETATTQPESAKMRLATVPWYLWIVLLSAFLGWLFDAMDLNLLTLVLSPSVSSLTHTTDQAVLGRIGGTVAGIKLFAWGLGGVIFGVVTDRIGRARTMWITIIIYAVFTGLSAISTNWIEFMIFQALAGVGIGGEWSAGAALVTETWPESLRAKAMQIMQMAFSFGFFVAAVINLILGPISWRLVFAAGILPVFATLLVRKYVREPERWVNARKLLEASDKGMARSSTASLKKIFGKDLRRVTIVGAVVSLAMMIGCWGGLTWIPSWIGQLLGPGQKIHASSYISYAMMLMNAGAVLGYLTLIWLTSAVGRRWAYFIFCAGGLLVSLYLFTQVNSVGGVLAVMPIYGYFCIGGFGTFAAYLPELFPTVVRATGQGFCWNIARLLTGFGPFIGGILIGTFGSITAAAAMISLLFIVGLVAIWFGPETQGRQIQDF